MTATKKRAPRSAAKQSDPAPAPAGGLTLRDLHPLAREKALELARGDRSRITVRSYLEADVV